MTQELHYTSLPRGLRPGSRGFCTVASTSGMPVTLTERLESLSGYQPVYPPGDLSEAKNPIVFAHFRLTIHQRPLSILSRIGPAGLDYSGRPNKYAHHLVLDPNERPEAGPGWLLTLPDILQTHWTGEPRELATGRPVPRGDNPPRIAQAWRKLTGDAGWAGVLAESFLDDPKRPAYLLFQPGMNLLPLFAEALSLLPPSRRWEVDFTTYLTQLPQGVTCAWRGVVEGSPEATHARRLPNALIIDLSHPLGTPTGGPLVHLARTGERVEPTQSAPSTSQATKPQPAPPPSSPHALTAGRSTAHKPAPATSPDFALIPELAARVKPRRSSRTFDPSTRTQPKAGNHAWIWVSAIASFVGLIGTIAFLGVKFSSREDALIQQVLAQREKRNASADKEKADQQQAADSLNAEQERKIASNVPKQPPVKPTPAMPVTTPDPPAPTPLPRPVNDAQPRKPAAIAVIVPDVFELDDPLSGLRDFTQKPLIIKPDDPPITELKLLGVGNGLSCETTKFGSGQRITVSSTKTASAAEELAKFELIDGRRVEFTWNRNITPLTRKEERRALKDCVLAATIKSDDKRCQYYLLRKKPEKPKTKHDQMKRVERKQDKSANWHWKYVWDPDPALYSDAGHHDKLSIEGLQLFNSAEKNVVLDLGKDFVLKRSASGDLWTGEWKNEILVKFSRQKGVFDAELMDSKPSNLGLRIKEKNGELGEKMKTMELAKSKSAGPKELKELQSEIDQLKQSIDKLRCIKAIYDCRPSASIAYEVGDLKLEIAKIYRDDDDAAEKTN